MPILINPKYLLIGLDIVIFAIIGYVLGQYFNKELIGLMIGTILGTIIMWFHLFYIIYRTSKKPKP
ncbi:MAG: hypothetical protein QXF09_02885 [Nitrososphaerota archaeon]